MPLVFAAADASGEVTKRGKAWFFQVYVQPEEDVAAEAKKEIV